MEKDKNGLIIPSQEHKYVIGIDFGHGETSAAYCEIEWGVPVSQLSRKEAGDIELNGKDTTIVSAISETADGHFKIGRDILDDKNTLKDFQIGFKKEPTDINGREEQLMIQYMSEVYKAIRKNSLFTDENHVVYIAFPSGWKRNETTLNVYKEMALQAGLPLADLIPESRAAFIHINLKYDVQNYMNKGLVVFDLGSSTLDLTYMRLSDGQIFKIDDGKPLGASIIENCIMKDKVESNQDACRLFQEYPIFINEMLLNCRDVKEKYYNKLSAGSNFVSVKYYIDDFDERADVKNKYEDLRILIRYEKCQLEELIEKEVSYQTRIKEFLSEFQSNQLNGAPIYYVFLTGGASRMTFIKNIVAEVWHLPEEVIKGDTNPSLSVSQGIAETGRAQARTYEMISKLEKEKNEILEKNLNIADDIIRSLSDSIVLELIGNLMSGINWFQWSNRDLSFNDLEKDLRYRLCNNLNIGDRFSTLFNKSIKQELAIIEKRVQEIVSNYTSRKVGLKNDFSISFTQSTYSIGSDIIASINKTVDEIIDMILFEWIDLLGYILLGVWEAIKLPYTMVKYLYDSIFKSNEERARDERIKRQEEREELALKKARKLTASQRKEAVEEFSKKIPEIKKDLGFKVYASLKGSTVLKNSIRKESNRILEDFINKSIEQARLLYV